MVNNMFSIQISLFDGQTYTLPILRGFSPKFIDSTGAINSDGIKFLTNEFYFLNQIRSGMVRCTNFKSLFMMFAHKNVIRESITIKTSFASRDLKDCSKIFNHTHIGMNNFLTPEGIELVFGSQQFITSWIHINNYIPVFNEYYDYCVAHVSQPVTHQPSIPTFKGFGSGFGSGFDITSQTQPTLAPLVSHPTRFIIFEEPKDSEKIDTTKFIEPTETTKTTKPSTPQKKHKADEELVCPGAPKKGRK